MAEKHKSPKPGGRGKKPAAGDDAQFDAFLVKQFAALRAELDAQMTASSGKAGKLVELKEAQKARTAGTSILGYFDKWKYGIAAAVVVAVAVPMVLQVNRQRAEIIQQSTTIAPAQNQPEGKAMNDRLADREEAEIPAVQPRRREDTQDKYYSTTRTAPAKDARIANEQLNKREKLESTAPVEAERGRSDGYLTKEEAKAPEPAKAQQQPGSNASGGELALASRDKGERSVAAGAPAPSAPAVERPAASAPPAPVMPAKKRSAAPRSEAEPKRDAASMADADETPAAKPRSFSLDDTNAKLKKQSIADEEKAEMEKLWKEYEKDPAAFSKDKSRSARLRTLLARHDTKSRAKRMRTIPAK